MFIFLLNIIIFFFILWFSIKNGIFIIYFVFRVLIVDLNIMIGLVLIVIILFILINIKNNGVFGYLKGFVDLILVMLLLNVVGEFVKLLNIFMRLFGNMFVGMVIMGFIYMVVFYFVLVVLYLYFDLFVGLV